MRLYDSVRRRGRLWRAWSDVHRNAISSKSADTRTEANAFKQEIVRHIERIARQLQQNRFRFLPQKGVLIPKASGQSRPIVIAPLESRIVQRSILDALQDIPALRQTLCAGYNFGGVPGKDFGVPGAILRAQSEFKARPYYIRTDVKSFFERVNKSLAIRHVLRFVNDEKFADLFERAVDTEIADASNYGPNIRLFPLHDQGVAQGSCLSPLLCNLLLADLDLRMNDRGIVSIRYIDDILILGRSAEAVVKAFAAAQEMLTRLGLECYNPRRAEDRGKAEQGIVSRGLTFLGCELTGSQVRPSRENRRELLSGVRTAFDESLHLLTNASVAAKAHGTYAETITLVGKIVQGWANTFGFCTDDRVMGGLDAEITSLVEGYTKSVFTLLRRSSPLNRRRGLGVFAIADRVQPLATKLLRSLNIDSAECEPSGWDKSGKAGSQQRS